MVRADNLFFRQHFWARLIGNIGIVFAALCLRFQSAFGGSEPSLEDPTSTARIAGRLIATIASMKRSDAAAVRQPKPATTVDGFESEWSEPRRAR